MNERIRRLPIIFRRSTLIGTDGLIARLPESMLVDNEIEQMRIGETGLTVPWAMEVSIDGRCFLRPSYTFERTRQRGGTLQMVIGRNIEGYEVGVPIGYKYKPSDIQVELYIPVRKVYEAPWRY
jgi:hypothetical protein